MQPQPRLRSACVALVLVIATALSMLWGAPASAATSTAPSSVVSDQSAGTDDGGAGSSGIESDGGNIRAGLDAGSDEAEGGVAPDVGTTEPVSVHPWFRGKYEELGGADGPLGEPIAEMACQSNSCWQEFVGGVLTSDGREIVRLSTAYVATWLAEGGPDGYLGLVAGGESCFGTYCVTPFDGGVVRWIPDVGVDPIAVDPWFQDEWHRLGDVSGTIGSPISTMRCQSSSCWQEFTGGVLTSDGSAIVSLSTAYVSTWLAWGGPDGDLGLVSGGEACFGDHCEAPFTGGVLIWVPSKGVFPVANAWFYPAWKASGGALGSLGLPMDAMQCQASACYQVFEKGTLTSSTSGVVALSSAYVSTWLVNGGPDGPLGLITGAETCHGTYCQVTFQNGLLVWQPGSGVRMLIGQDATDWIKAHQPVSPPPATTPPATTPPGNPGDSRNCDDFRTQAEAQEWFDRYYPYYGDVAKLDRDKDGVACE